jgi:hypothetical protein
MPTGSGFIPRPTLALPQLGQAERAGGEIATESGACQALLARRVGLTGGAAGRSGLRRDGPSIRMVMQ